jgi:hypothetical protein
MLLPDLSNTHPETFEAETLKGSYPGVLLAPRLEQGDRDGKYSQTYHAVCYMYVGERQAGDASGALARYIRRFAIHAPGRDALPLIRRVAQLLLLIYGENHARLHFDHPYNDTVDVWLTLRSVGDAGTDVGGEQFKNQIYIYNIAAERSPIEWAREVAHEYGHYALPGISGFKEPEEWANGVLGERLFLKWLNEDLRLGVLRPDELPFVSEAQLAEYINKQVTPLVRRIALAHDGYDGAALTRRDAAAMDNYTALALYVDTVYGSPMLLNALQYTEPKAGSTFVLAPDFLRGVLAALRGATELTISPPILSGERTTDTIMVYLPAGEWTVSAQGPIRSWEVRTEGKGVHPEGKTGLLITRSDWRRLALSYGTPVSQQPRLVLHKKEAQLQ